MRVYRVKKPFLNFFKRYYIILRTVESAFSLVAVIVGRKDALKFFIAFPLFVSNGSVTDSSPISRNIKSKDGPVGNKQGEEHD